MSELFSLDSRLLTCAGLVRSGARLADIGTDHAYLPVWLLKKGKISFAFACDINEKPLQSGRQTAERYKADNIEFRLGSGMKPLRESDRLTDIVIAGMGGELIVRILAESPLSKNPELNFVLQPMSKSDELIDFLCCEGFEITRQLACQSKGKFYTVLSCAYTGQAFVPDELFRITGKLDCQDEQSRGFLGKQLNNLQNKSRGDSSLDSLCQKLRSILNEKNQ